MTAVSYCATSSRMNVCNVRRLLKRAAIVTLLSAGLVFWLTVTHSSRSMIIVMTQVRYHYARVSTYAVDNGATTSNDDDRNQTSSSSLPPTSRPNNETTYVVPNIVHFIWFDVNSDADRRQLTFINYVSIRSVYVNHKPETIMLHCNRLPVGLWWQRLTSEIPLQIVHREPPESIYGQIFGHVYHSSDVAKLEIILEYGGIYLDYDVIVINSLNPLRQYDATMGKEREPKLNAGVVIGRRNATFIRLLHESYRNRYDATKWDYNCAVVPYQIYLQNKNLLHVESNKLTTPDWIQRYLLWYDVIEWRHLYVVHLMAHGVDSKLADQTPDSIRTIKTTFGQLVRYIYYGSPEVLPETTLLTNATSSRTQ